MKLGLSLIGLAMAGKGGKGGKHGGRDIVGEGLGRFLHHTPNCVSGRSGKCIRKEFTTKSGEIEFGPSEYVSKTNYLYQISVGANRRIKLKFDKEYGFEMEYHKTCGYDKVHIYSGSASQPESMSRLARFCGPKNGQKHPFDGSKKIKVWKQGNVGRMAMWDWKLNAGIGDAFIAVDLDQDFSGYRGFKITWTTEVINMPNFSRFTEGHEWAHESCVNFIRANVDIKTQNVVNSVNKYFKAAQTRVKNMSATKCGKHFNDSVGYENRQKMISIWEDLDGRKVTYDDIVQILDHFTDILEEYIGSCKNFKTWNVKKNTQLDKISKFM